MADFKGLKERIYYAFLCIWWRESSDYSRRAHIAQQRKQEGSNG